MASSLDSVPPWLQITPNLFTSAMESGANVGLQVAAQSQRAQEMAAARAERESTDQERQAQEAERQRQFDESHLLNVQKVAQDAAQLQQQTAHQTALEAHQRDQESRLLNYDTGRLAVENRRAATAEQQATVNPTWYPASNGEPGKWVTRSGNVVPQPVADLPPRAVQGQSVLDAQGNQIATSVGGNREIPTPTLSPAGAGELLTHEETGILKQLSEVPMWAAANDKDNPRRAEYDALMAQLADVRSRRESLLKGSAAPASVLAPVAKVVGVLGQGTRDDPARPQNQQQFDSMRPGTFFINPADGKTRVKK